MKKILSTTLVFLTLFSCTKSRDLAQREIYSVIRVKLAGFDPVTVGDVYVALESGKVFEGLYEFHPLKRPYELMPNLAEALPEVSADGLTYTIKIKKGVLFQDDPAFPGGKGRELTVHDLIYSIKRNSDPKIISKGFWTVDGKIAGLNEWRDKNAKAAVTNYDEEIPGMKAIDNYTIAFTLTKPYPQFLYALAQPYCFVMSQEVVKHYGPEVLNHPVGTGPFRLKSFDGNRIVYEKNPTFREKLYPSEGEASDKEKGLLDDAGKKLPLVDRIIVDIHVESQPAWFAFQKGKVDIYPMAKDNMAEALGEGNQLKAGLPEKGIELFMAPQMDLTYLTFNHNDPLFKNKKLRQAMSLATNRADDNRLFFHNSARIAHGPIPPGMNGYDPEFKNPWVELDLAQAKKLLAEAGYPEGKGLPEIVYDSSGDTTGRQMAELFQKNMADLGVKIKINGNTWPEISQKLARSKFQIIGMGWTADYPDAENFLGLLYCPNKSPGSNSASYCNPEYDKLFEKAVIMQDGPERAKLYAELNRMAAEDVPWILSFHRTKFTLKQSWLKNYKPMEFNYHQQTYWNVDVEKKQEMLKKF